MKPFSKELFLINGYEFSFYFNLTLLLILSYSNYKCKDKEKERLWGFQIGGLGMNLRIVKFNTK